MRVIQALRADRRAMAVMGFALMLIPILGLVGLAVDWSYNTTVKSRLDVAADSAAMAAVTAAARAVAGGEITDPQKAALLGKQIGDSTFSGQAAYAGAKSLSAESSGGYTTVTANGSGFVAEVKYNAVVRPWIGQMFLVNGYHLVGASQAVTGIGSSYTDIVFLIDNSQSMGLGATLGDQYRLGNAINASHLQNDPLSLGGGDLPGFGPFLTNGSRPRDQDGYVHTPGRVTDDQTGQMQVCGFACHWSNSGDDAYALARSRSDIRLRIDNVTQGTQDAIAAIAAQAGAANTVQVGAYSFARNLNQVVGLTNDFGQAAQAVSKVTIDLSDRLPYANYHAGDTDFVTVFNSLASTLPAGGDGSSAKHKKVIVLITDGVYDMTPNSGGVYQNRVWDTMNRGGVNACQKMKDKGYTVYVMNVQYDPIYTSYYSPSKGRRWDSTYESMVSDGLFPGTEASSLLFYPSHWGGTNNKTAVENALKACASSSDKYSPVTDSSDFSAVLKTMVGDALMSGARFSQ